MKGLLLFLLVLYAVLMFADNGIALKINWLGSKKNTTRSVKKVFNSTLLNSRVRPIVPDLDSKINSRKVANITKCGGVLTKAPGQIVRNYNSKSRVKESCTWKIQAPVNYTIYIDKLVNTLTADKNSSKINDNSLKLGIYDGNKVLARKNLFLQTGFNKYNSSGINYSVSSGRNLTIDLKYDESKKYPAHGFTLRYGFVKKADVLRLRSYD